LGTNGLKKWSIILRREKVMLPSVEGTISFRFFRRNLMDGWGEVGRERSGRERSRRDRERSEEGRKGGRGEEGVRGLEWMLQTHRKGGADLFPSGAVGQQIKRSQACCDKFLPVY